MATYVKGFKKQTPEQLLLKVIVGIVLTVVAIVLVVLMYDLLTVDRSYDDFTSITTYADVLSQTDENSDQIPNYLVYFYSETNTTSENIKQDVLKYAAQIEKAGIPVFFVNTANTTDDDTALDPFLTEIDEASLRVPTMITVVDGSFQEKFVSTDPILQILEDVKSGSYAPFN